MKKTNKEAVERWNKLKEYFLKESKEIDKITVQEGEYIVEPDWWVTMMQVRMLINP